MDFADKFYVLAGLSYSSQYQGQNNNLNGVVKVFIKCQHHVPSFDFI